MTQEAPRPGPGVGSRLESWLVRTIRRGHLRDYPLYYPLRGTVGYPPEQYARRLLSRLRVADQDLRTLERIKDDGRAFRTWAETSLAVSEKL